MSFIAKLLAVGERMEIGIKIKQLRLSLALTQEELADRCELTKGYISQLENDLTSPSIATLVDLLNALGTSLKDFFAQDTEEKIVFTKEDYFEKVTEDTTITWLVPNSQKNMLEPIEMTVQPKSQSIEDMPHEGEEFGYLLQGRVKLHVGKKIYIIKAGETFYFKSDKMHYIENVGDKPAKLVWISTPPNF